jgi:bifunctional non-homologous end joining protein LigD
MNSAYRPMLATLVDEPFDDKEWVFENKWDGFRLITEKRGKTVRLWSWTAPRFDRTGSVAR